MTKSWRGVLLLSASLAVPFLILGCNPASESGGPTIQNVSGPENPNGRSTTPSVISPKAAPGGPPTQPGIRQVMIKLGRKPDALTDLLGAELNEAQPPWETIQGQTKEYVSQVGELAKYEPRRGDKESWAKHTKDFAESAAELDKAAQAKDKDAALAAHGQITSSCKSCHDDHRMMRGPRMMGGPGRGGPGRGGPPPGGPGPGGPPPGGEPPK